MTPFKQFTPHILIAGAGIGGLAAALACHQAGCTVQVLEQASVLAEVGAGLQLGPNAVRVLDAWGLGDAVRAVASAPQRLQVRDAATGRVLGQMALGASFRQRYGCDYLTLHRADLQQLLLAAVQLAGVPVQLQSTSKNIAATSRQISIKDQNDASYVADALLGCDGLWSGVRQHLLHDGRPQPTGHVAYRAMLTSAEVPTTIAQDQVTVWLGPKMHAVAYPVRGGALFNVVVIVHGDVPAGDTRAGEGWNRSATTENLLRSIPVLHSMLHNLMNSASVWKLWVLHDRPPVQRPTQMAQGRIALLGDAAHPMRPYLAQGAAMALEDAQALGLSLRAALRTNSHGGDGADALPQALQTYAAARWQRNARVQAKAQRNGQVFHASGPLRIARNLAMAGFGERLLDTRWLYGGSKN